jgi:dipeptidyl aminopeptidase/acylaminoacyl peptidase
MFGPKATMFVFLVAGLALSAAPIRGQKANQSEREAMYYRYMEFASYVKGGSMQPHWMADGSSFWYAEGVPANTVIYKVDPEANTKTRLFDTARLRQVLTPVLGQEPPYRGLPFSEFTFVDDEKAVKFTLENKEFVLQLDSYALTPARALTEEQKNQLPRIMHGPWGDMPEEMSPDRRWFISLRDHNLWLRSNSQSHGVPITTDGVEGYEWGHDLWNKWAGWAPDSRKLVSVKIDLRAMPKIPVVHYLGRRETVEWVQDENPPADDPMPATELFTVNIPSGKRVRVKTGQEQPLYFYPHPGWRPDGSELLFEKVSREYKKLELMAANPTTGATGVILTETQNTFLIGIAYWLHPKLFTWVPDGKRFIWMSERDGWNHFYLYDLQGKLIRRLTQGNFPVVEVVAVDDKGRWVYFIAHSDPQRPYDSHLYRVDFEGKGLSRLTEGIGQHDIEFAPSKHFFLDTNSSSDRPPVVELGTADGKLLQVISKAYIDALKQLKWSPPEEFVVKAADGKTDTYGILYKPYDFDPNKKYPVIDRIYAGPQHSVVPRHFFSRWIEGVQPLALAQLGFIVFMVDGRGTPERGKAFQDVVYGNIGRHEIPDHVAALKQLAETRPYLDLSRVGIYGGSFGGYFTIRAMLLAPDVYHVGVAAAAGGGDKVDQEPYMGLPEHNKAGYEYASNLPLVGNLRGKLFLMVGTSDVVAPFSGTMKMVDALVRAGKMFDLLVMPEKGHVDSITSPYYREAVRRYFQEHLNP